MRTRTRTTTTTRTRERGGRWRRDGRTTVVSRGGETRREEGDGDAAGEDKDDEDAPPRHPLLKMLLERNARNDDADEDDEGDGRTKAVKVPLKVTAAPSAAGGGRCPTAAAVGNRVEAGRGPFEHGDSEVLESGEGGLPAVGVGLLV